MRFNQGIERPQRQRAGPDLVGQRRQAQIHTLSGVALALPIERLVLTKLLEQNHRQKRRPGEAAWRDVERRRRLGDCLAFSTREALPDGLDHLPLTRDDLERLRDVFAELRQLGGAAAWTSLRRGDDEPL